MMIGPRQTLRTKLETSGPVITETAKAELGASSDEMIDALTLKTASQAALSARLAHHNFRQQKPALFFRAVSPVR